MVLTYRYERLCKVFCVVTRYRTVCNVQFVIISCNCRVRDKSQNSSCTSYYQALVYLPDEHMKFFRFQSSWWKIGTQMSMLFQEVNRNLNLRGSYSLDKDAHWNSQYQTARVRRRFLCFILLTIILANRSPNSSTVRILAPRNNPT